jgi:hypothetical protein
VSTLFRAGGKGLTIPYAPGSGQLNGVGMVREFPSGKLVEKVLPGEVPTTPVLHITCNKPSGQSSIAENKPATKNRRDS